MVFQINTAAAGILYQSAIDMSEVKEDSTVIDICCGTGTIGLCFAKVHASYVQVYSYDCSIELGCSFSFSMSWFFLFILLYN